MGALGFEIDLNRFARFLESIYPYKQAQRTESSPMEIELLIHHLPKLILYQKGVVLGQHMNNETKLIFWPLVGQMSAKIGSVASLL